MMRRGEVSREKRDERREEEEGSKSLKVEGLKVGEGDASL
jgi:hypothetical protein